MLRIAICDDDKFVLDNLAECLLRYSFANNYEIQVQAFSTSKELLASSFPYQVLFLDIMLDNKQDGIEIAKHLRQTDSTTLIIIISSRTDRHADAISATVFRYVIKPFTQKDIDCVVDEAFKHLRENMRIFSISFAQDTEYVFLHDIILVESYARKRYICTKDRKIRTTETWHSLLERIGVEHCFFKVQKTILINFHHVQGNTKTEVTLNNGRRIPFGKGGYYVFQSAYTKFLGELR